MKKIGLVLFICVLLSVALSAETVMNGLFESADQVSADIARTLNTQGDLLIEGVSLDGIPVKLGDLFADLTANRLAGRSGFRPTVVKSYSSLRYLPSTANWTLSGSLYEAGAGYLFTLQLINNENGSQLKGWEFGLSADGMEPLSTPSQLALMGERWDAYEPNNEASSATLVTLPFNADELTFSGEADEDWFAIDVPEGNGETAYVLRARTAGMLDTYLELFAPDNTDWARVEDDDTDGANAVIEFPLTQSGRWYLKARGYSSGDEGSYSLSITLSEEAFGPGEPDEGVERATRLNIGVPPLEKRIDYGSDSDWFRIDLAHPLGRDEILRLEVFSDMDLIMEFYDEYENYIQEDDDGGEGNNPIIVSSGLDAGTYYAVVSGYSGETGPYEILANVMVPVRDEFESDDSLSSASVIRIDDAAQNRNFSPPGDVDWVRFEVVREDLYLMETTGEIDTYMELLDSEGRLIEENDDGNDFDYNAVIKRRLVPGIYYVQVVPYGNVNPDERYGLSIKTVH